MSLTVSHIFKTSTLSQNEVYPQKIECAFNDPCTFTDTLFSEPTVCGFSDSGITQGVVHSMCVWNMHDKYPVLA